MQKHLASISSNNIAIADTNLPELRQQIAARNDSLDLGAYNPDEHLQRGNRKTFEGTFSASPIKRQSTYEEGQILQEFEVLKDDHLNFMRNKQKMD